MKIDFVKMNATKISKKLSFRTCASVLVIQVALFGFQNTSEAGKGRLAAFLVQTGQADSVEKAHFAATASTSSEVFHKLEVLDDIEEEVDAQAVSDFINDSRANPQDPEADVILRAVPAGFARKLALNPLDPGVLDAARLALFTYQNSPEEILLDRQLYDSAAKVIERAIINPTQFHVLGTKEFLLRVINPTGHQIEIWNEATYLEKDNRAARVMVTASGNDPADLDQVGAAKAFLDAAVPAANITQARLDAYVAGGANQAAIAQLAKLGRNVANANNIRLVKVFLDAGIAPDKITENNLTAYNGAGNALAKTAYLNKLR